MTKNLLNILAIQPQKNLVLLNHGLQITINQNWYTFLY